MMSVRETIKEAVTRANIVPRRQAVPGSLEETAFKSLVGIISKYNKDNLLAFTQNSVELPLKSKIHIYDESNTLLSKGNYVYDTVDQLESVELTKQDVEEKAEALVKESGYENTLFYAMSVGTPDGPVYTWANRQIREPRSFRVQEMSEYRDMYHFKCPDVCKINNLYLVRSDGEVPVSIGTSSIELHFMPYDKFDRCSPSSPVYTFVEKAEGEWFIQIKEYVARQDRFKINLNYNRSIHIDIDDDLIVPDNYAELLITALTHKLALQFPRLNDAQMERLAIDLKTMIENVRTPKADVRQVLRDFGPSYRTGTMTQWELESGDWLF